MTQIVSVPGVGNIGFPDDMTREEITKVLSEHDFSADTHNAPVTAGGLAKAAAAGVGRGLTGIAGLPNLLERGGRWLAGNQGQPVMPSANDIESAIEKYTGQWHDPQNTAEDYAQTIGEFAPGMAAGPEGLATRALTSVVAPAVASETAGQLTAGTPFEPVARIAGAMAGGHLGAPSAAFDAAKRAQALRATADAEFDAVRRSGAYLKNNAANTVGLNARATLNHDGLYKSIAPKTHKILKKLADRPLGHPWSMSEVQATRMSLGHAARSIEPSERLAARTALDHLDNYLSDIPTKDIALGNAQHSADTLKNAIANYAASSRAERLLHEKYAAENTAASQNSGMNLGNVLRGRGRNILNSVSGAKRGFNKAELKQMERVVRGTLLGNLARKGGNVLAGGHGIGTLLSGGAGYATAGPFGAVAFPVGGMVLRYLANRSTMRQFSELEKMVSQRAPAAAPLPHVASRMTPALLSAMISGMQQMGQHDRTQ